VAPLLVNAGRATITGLLTASTSKFVAVGTGATAEAATQTALVTEVETRTSGAQTQQTTSATNDTYQVVGAVTATTTRALQESGVFDASTVGNMLVRGVYTTVNLNTSDSISLTWKLQFT
jgi:hypothetical protein